MESTSHCRILLQPTHTELTASRGQLLRDLLFEQGVEFPCGGRGRCRGCRVRVRSGDAPVNAIQREILSEEEIEQGWRLACQCVPESDLEIELRQWDSAILVDDSKFSFEPRDGLGVAVDLGTTTIVAQLLDLRTGNVRAVRTALNAQARYGADVMSRIHFAVLDRGQGELQRMVREQIGGLIQQLLAASQEKRGVVDVVIVGNTVMHDLFCGIDVEPLSHYPFDSPHLGLQRFGAAELGWKLEGNPTAYFLPCLGSFVGSDILAGILATRLHERDRISGFVDLGTNGEIVIGNRERMLCTSTAAGPAFEGARISMGMRAASGAISEVRVDKGELCCHVLGDIAPQGICGSGLVDAVAAGLEIDVIGSTGRFANGAKSWILRAPVSLNQNDVRELQLAKAAIAAGIKLLSREAGTGELDCLYLAGAFGNYINRASAQRIGLVNFPPEKVKPVGNTALLGAKIALFDLPRQRGEYVDIRNRVQHVSLNLDTNFQEEFIAEMVFPGKRTVQT
ncbi:MAG TPA: ASKHA domain-containing protein [Candidatus Sulfotelmatobacter sp.]|nr:ASKHA domain-containing protein [Candidatus Sulfotelmatobacter sp.]